MFDVITFGSATRDLFLKSEGFKVGQEKRFFNGKGLVISLGSKIPVKELHFFTGGGGTNTALTFQKQGFKVAYCGMVGGDFGGKEIIKELKENKISTDLIFVNKKYHSNYSVVLLTEDERTILVFRGASENLKVKDIPWRKIKTKWLYIAPLSGKLLNIFEPLLSFAKKSKIKIALNPGNTQLSFPKKKLKEFLNFADVLILNQEEASLATGLPYHKEKEIFKTLDEWVDGIVVMTKGPFGAVISDGKWLWQVGILKIPRIVDRTGAGDAFGSGFVVGLIRAESCLKGSGRQRIWSSKARLGFADERRKGETLVSSSEPRIEYAIQLASANATSCLRKMGAKNGLLKKSDNIFKWGKVKIQKIKLTTNN